jgi:pSer/pThr/pTyr-binding forkhead associated (FHA) protein
MDEPFNDETAYALHEPHLELPPPQRAGFVPLVLTVPPDAKRVEITRNEAILGRHSRADVRLALPEISRRHCRFNFDGQWHVTDLQSLNGVWVNGERVHEAVVYDGDHLRLGCCVLTIEQGTPRRESAPAGANDFEIGGPQNVAETLPRQAG